MMFWVLELPETWSKISAQIVYKKLGFNLFYKKTCFVFFITLIYLSLEKSPLIYLSLEKSP